MEYTESEKHCIAIIEKALPDNGSPRGLATTILNNIKAKGYLIGKRSIVPEISDEQVEKAIIEVGTKKFGVIPAPTSLYAMYFKDGVNWLRSQINK